MPNNFKSNMSPVKSYSKYTPRASNKNKRNPQFKAPKLFIERGDQRVTIKHQAKLDTIDNGTSSSSTYFHGFSLIKPFHVLATSPYKGYSDLYSLVRLSSYSVTVSIPGSHHSLPGATAAKLYRDKRPEAPNPFYEGIVAENSHKRGKSYTTFKFAWYPIEPSDVEFYPFDENIDNGRYGQINVAGIAFPAPFNETYSPLVEYRFNYDFKYLKEIATPSLLYSLTDNLRGLELYDSDEENQNQNFIKIEELDTTRNLYLPSDYRTLKTKHDIELIADNYFKGKNKPK